MVIHTNRFVYRTILTLVSLMVIAWMPVFGQVPTNTILGSGKNPECSNVNITFTATVATTSPIVPVTTGTVEFFDGTTPLGLPVIVSPTGTATISISFLVAGSHQITAKYSGDIPSGLDLNVSNLITQTINPLPTAIIGASTTTVCQLDPIEPLITFIGSNGTANYAFNFTINSSSNTINTSLGDNLVSTRVATGTSGTYTYHLVSVIDANGCMQDQSGMVTVTVNDQPSLSGI